MAGIAIKGRDVTFTLGGGKVIGTLSKNITLNNESIDTTDDDSSGWIEKAAVAGVKSMEMGISGKVKNYELFAAFFGTSQIMEAVITFPDGATTNTTITVDMFLDSVSQSMESNTGSTFDCSISSAGAPEFVAGT